MKDNPATKYILPIVPFHASIRGSVDHTVIVHTQVKSHENSGKKRIHVNNSM